MFIDQQRELECRRFLDAWIDGSGGVRKAFSHLKESVARRENVVLDFVSRPRVSYSLRGLAAGPGKTGTPIFALIDVIDDDPENRWLSVCFYEDTITDPRGWGNLVPQGILGEDGYCFDVVEFEQAFLDYLEERIDEAHASTTKRAGSRV